QHKIMSARPDLERHLDEVVRQKLGQLGLFAQQVSTRETLVNLAAHQAGRVMRLFFFQAEDGIRDRNVTGVQTCALPILTSRMRKAWRNCLPRMGRSTLAVWAEASTRGVRPSGRFMPAPGRCGSSRSSPIM